MLGLGAYDSDEDGVPHDGDADVVQQETLSSNQKVATIIPDAQEGCSPERSSARLLFSDRPYLGRPDPRRNGLVPKDRRELNPVVRIAQGNEDSPSIGATVGPMVGPSVPSLAASPDPTSSTPASPYSASRSLIRDLTLPPVPDLDIPPSPPGSPPPGTTTKFAHFLELKKQGIHFNEKLAKSSALKNPSLLQKLMTFAGVDGQAQYASTLPKDIWDPEAFSAWAYKEGLAKSQQEITRRLEEEKAREPREAIDFVPATASGGSSRGGTPGLTSSGKGLGRSAAERIMAGLDRERTRSPLVPDGGKRREIERRGGRVRDRSRSRSRDRRKRSRSRSRSWDGGRGVRARDYDRRR
ncbi:MAG: hypothetical protein M1839_006009 [Geoglossum umbratile]|nr:MAG: hypothetical protein M1839_006009 [Geoglossum umbratile]